MPACSPACRTSSWSASPIPLPGTIATARAGLIGCRTLSTVWTSCSPNGVDAVTIAAPTHLHHDIALACIARGIHVLVEKPIASKVEEGREIVAAARAPA